MDAGPTYYNAAFVAERHQAEAVIRQLLRAGLLDPTRRIASGADVVIPVRSHPSLPSWAHRLGVKLVQDRPLLPRDGRRSPHEEVLDILRPALTPALLDAVPDKWEQHGDVLVLRLPGALREHGPIVGGAFAQVLGLRSVLDDPAGVSGEYREMSATLLWGDDPIATHVENGISYRFDASRIMFSSGNVHERMRVARLPARGETIVDMFAGIGYFTLPLAVHAGAARIHAIEKNPVSFQYLQENARANDVAGIIDPWLGDNREFPLEGIADRVMMGYVGGTRKFLPKAFALLKREGGVIHLHDTAHADHWKDELTRASLDAARACGTVVRVTDARLVKSYSPGVVHAVLELRVRR
ncbi:MAG: class I SAM-dependent methyltransferase family protein [Candidatus Thermoplasmatota archaeon]